MDLSVLNRLELDANFNVHGVAATYNPMGGSPFTTRVIVEHEVEEDRRDEDQRLIVQKLVAINVRIDQVPTSKRGDTIVVGAVTYTTDRQIANDGLVRKLRVH